MGAAVKFWLYGLLSILALISWALWNGFPLIYSDTGTYIASGFDKFIPVDRPYFYGFLLRYTSLGFSLWFSILFQAWVVWFTIRCFLAIWISRDWLDLSTFLSTAALSALTGLGYFTVLLIPDIYCPLALLLALVMIMRPEQLSKMTYAGIFIIYILALLVHFSTAILMVGCVFAFWLLSKLPVFRTSDLSKRIIKLGVFTLLAFPIALWWNHSLEKKWVLSKGSNLFIAARMMETGALKIYLDHACQDQSSSFSLCKDRDRFPVESYKFLWFMEESPLYDSVCMQKGWGSCWEDKNGEYGQMVSGVLGYGPSRWQHLKRIAADAWRQFIWVDVGHLTSQMQGSPAHDRVKLHLPADLSAYEQSRQGKATLFFPVLSLIQYVVLVISLIGLILFFMLLKGRQEMKGKNAFLLSMLLISLAGNAMVVSVFSTVIDRYQARLIWIVPLFLIGFMVQWLLERRAKHE